MILLGFYVTVDSYTEYFEEEHEVFPKNKSLCGHIVNLLGRMCMDSTVRSYSILIVFGTMCCSTLCMFYELYWDIMTLLSFNYKCF